MLDITQGVPRIKEIIDGAKKISTPVITAELEHNSNVNAARIVKGRIQKTVLGQVNHSVTEFNGYAVSWLVLLITFTCDMHTKSGM